MRSPPSSTPPANDATRESLRRASTIALAVFGGMMLVARPLANQLAPYAPDAAFASLLAIFFVCSAGLRAACSNRRLTAPENLILAIVLWIALFIWGALRSPHLGASIPLASDAILYALILLGGYFAGRAEPQLRVSFIRAIIAIVVVLACAAMWQVKVDLPRLRSLVASGEALMPDGLNSKIGLDRLNGDDAFATFGNPNSLAAFMLVGFFLLLGHVWDPMRARAASLFTTVNGRVRFAVPSASNVILLNLFPFLGALLLATLYWTGSKGGGVAFLFGCWFFLLQRWNTRFPFLNTLTIVGLAALLILLGLGLDGVIPSKFYGLSMQVRFDYWTSALSMFVRHPLQGVGVGGYAEWYSIFKTPLGWESKDPHNEFVALLCELGVLGPIFYVLIWWLVLRNSGKFRASLGEPVSALRELKWRDADILVPAAGAFSFILYIGGFGILNSGEIFSVFHGGADRLTILCALETVCLPLLFVLIVALQRWDARVFSRAARAEAPDSNAMLHGFRAAAGAILMHQLVDFDFKAQAVMISLFLCGGLFWGAAASEQKVEVSAPSFVSRRAAWIAVAFALLLLPTAFWIPFYSGIARSEASDNQTYLQQITAHPEKSRGDLSADDAKSEVLSARLRAWQAAPYDAEALVEYALARLTLERHGPFDSNEREILELLKQASVMRPLSAQPHVLMGSLHLHRALAAPDVEKRPHFERARSEFAAARALYPLHPGFAFMEGDVWLLMGEPAKACEQYGHAYAIDMAINDPNVYIAAIFNDPRPGVFSRHGCDGEVRDALKEYGDSAAPRCRLGLLARDMCATANVLSEMKKNGALPATNRTAAALLSTVHSRTEELTHVPADLPARAHAAFLLAVCEKNSERLGSDGTALKTIEDRARALQNESIQAGSPGTVPRIFNELIGK